MAQKVAYQTGVNMGRGQGAKKVAKVKGSRMLGGGKSGWQKEMEDNAVWEMGLGNRV